MIEWLEKLDRQIIYAVNSWHSPFWDEVMWIVSKIPTWLPLYALLVFLVYRKTNLRKMLYFLLSLLILVALTDQISSGFFKPFFARWRPSHNLLIPIEWGPLHHFEFKPGEFYKGGQFTFISGHASNSFAIATLAILVLRQHFKYIAYLLFFWASLVAYSRMYLGVHYLSDILVGACVGILLAFIVYRFLYLVLVKKFVGKVKLEDDKNSVI